MAFIDVDDTIRQVHGYAKQGAAYGYSGVKGVNAQVAALSSPTCAPVIAAARLRKGNVISGHGAARLIGDAISAARTAGTNEPTSRRPRTTRRTPPSGGVASGGSGTRPPGPSPSAATPC